MIEIKKLRKEFVQGKHRICALNDVTLRFDNEMTAIVGTSGAGKSTLLNIMAGIEPINSGEVKIDGFQISNARECDKSKFRNEKIGIVMQHYSLISDFSVLENVYLPLLFSPVKYTKKQKISKAIEALKVVGIEHLHKRNVNELSGGQMQRVAIARAIVNSPQYIFADEPTGALDNENTDRIINLFRQINKSGVGIVIVTHDMNIANSCDRVIQLEDGKVISDFHATKK